MDYQTSDIERLLGYLFTILVIAGSLYYIFNFFNISTVAQTMGAVEPIWFLLAIVMFYITFPLRGVRWRRFLRNLDIQTNWISVNLILVAGYYLNVFIPAKGGDVYRSYRASTRYEASLSQIAGTVAAERVIDLFLLIAGLIVLLPLVFREKISSLDQVVFPIVLSVLIIGIGLLGLVLLGKLPLPEKVSSFIENFRYGIHAATINSDLNRLLILLLSLSIWCANIVRTMFLANALDIRISILEIALLALLVAFFSGLPYLPSGIGVVEVIGSQVLILLGVSRNAAIALILLDRFITMVTLLGVGSVVYLLVEHSTFVWRLSDEK